MLPPSTRAKPMPRRYWWRSSPPPRNILRSRPAPTTSSLWSSGCCRCSWPFCGWHQAAGASRLFLDARSAAHSTRRRAGMVSARRLPDRSFFARGMGNALVTIDASRRLAQELLVHRPHELFLLGHDAGVELVAMLAIFGIVLLELRPHYLGKTQAFFLEFFLGGYDSACFPDRVLDARLRLVPEQLGILMWYVTVVATSLHAETVGVMRALLVFLGNPLHRMAGATAEFVGAGCRHHDLGSNDSAGAAQQTDDHERED